MRKVTIGFLICLALVLSASRPLSLRFTRAEIERMNSNNYIRQTCGMTWTTLDTSTSNDGVDEAVLDLSASAPYGIPLCAVYEYETGEDDDLGWICDIESTNDGYYFRLEKLHDGDNGGRILARAVVLSYDQFKISGGVYFWITNDGIQYQNIDSDIVWKKDGDNAGIYFSYIPANAAPVTTINHYYTNEDDDFSFYSAMQWGDQNGTLVLDASDGNGGSYVYGTTYIIEPLDDGYNKGFIDENGLLITGNQDNYYVPFTYYRWPYLEEANTMMLSTLFTYRPNDHDFSVSASPERYEPDYSIVEDGNLEPGTRYYSHYGNDDSLFGFETVLLQTQPVCGW